MKADPKLAQQRLTRLHIRLLQIIKDLDTEDKVFAAIHDCAGDLGREIERAMRKADMAAPGGGWIFSGSEVVNEHDVAEATDDLKEAGSFLTDALDACTEIESGRPNYFDHTSIGRFGRMCIQAAGAKLYTALHARGITFDPFGEHPESQKQAA